MKIEITKRKSRKSSPKSREALIPLEGREGSHQKGKRSIREGKNQTREGHVQETGKTPKTHDHILRINPWNENTIPHKSDVRVKKRKKKTTRQKEKKEKEQYQNPSEGVGPMLISAKLPLRVTATDGGGYELNEPPRSV